MYGLSIVDKRLRLDSNRARFLMGILALKSSIPLVIHITKNAKDIYKYVFNAILVSSCSLMSKIHIRYDSNASVRVLLFSELNQ